MEVAYFVEELQEEHTSIDLVLYLNNQKTQSEFSLRNVLPADIKLVCDIRAGTVQFVSANTDGLKNFYSPSLFPRVFKDFSDAVTLLANCELLIRLYDLYKDKDEAICKLIKKHITDEGVFAKNRTLANVNATLKEIEILCEPGSTRPGIFKRDNINDLQKALGKNLKDFGGRIHSLNVVEELMTNLANDMKNISPLSSPSPSNNS